MATGTESIAEDDEHDANDLLQEGLEQALRRREIAIESFPAYVPDTDTGEDVQAEAQAAHQIATTEVVAVAEKAWALEKKALYRDHCDALEGRRRVESVHQAHE